MKTIRVLISPTGEVRVETKGFSGPSCRDASQFVEDALGTRCDEQLKAEFHLSETSQHAVQERAS